MKNTFLTSPSGVYHFTSSKQYSPNVILVAKSKSGEKYHKIGHFSLLSGEYQPPLVLEKNRTSLRKSTSSPVSHLGNTACLLSIKREVLTCCILSIYEVYL